MAMRETRSVRRDGFDDHTRITLAEDDIDEQERRQGRIEGKLDRVTTWLITGAISFGFSAILLSANIAITLRR